MNIYFLVEGKQTEMKVYPKWLSYLIPKLSKVQWHHQVINNNYCIFTGSGFPSLLDNHLRNSIADVNSSGNFDYFVICLDSDDDTIEERKKLVLDFIMDEEIVINPNTQLVIIVQNKCLETWFLAHTKNFKKNPINESLREYVGFYNVKSNDPELMGKIPDFEGSTSIFHSSYLQQLLSERNIKYTKNNPQGVMEEYFLQNLINRNQKTGHIQSFKFFIDFCIKIKAEMSK
jgi:hypothetical protein